MDFDEFSEDTGLEKDEPMDEIVDSSDSSSDNDDDCENNEIVGRLIQQVTDNPYLYDAHVQLINSLRKLGDLDKLRNARQKMSEYYPLTEELWISWINDEKNLAITNEENLKIFDLFERAVNDYISVNLWIEFGQFCIGIGNIEKCRSVFEKGVTACGLHVVKGSLIWETYREFELAILSTLQSPPETEVSAASQNDEEITKQKFRILNLFKRQLSVPLLEMENTYVELEKFVGNVDNNIQLGYKKALSKLEKVMQYEKALMEGTTSNLEFYISYIDFEISEGDPSRVQCLFERSLIDNCLSPDIWNRYTRYLYATINIESVIIPVFERAIRNCPWSVEIWQGYLRSMEKHDHCSDKIKEVAEKAFASGFTTADELRQLWLTYLEYLRRRTDWNDGSSDLEILRSSFERAHSFLSESFGSEGDPQCEILQYWARIEAQHCKNIEKTREIWSDIMQSGHAKFANMWAEYINLELRFGDSKHVRKTFVKALNAASDWPESIGNSWLKFERDEGDLDQLENAISKISARTKFIVEQRQKAEEKLNQTPSTLKLKKKKFDKNNELTEKRGTKRKATSLSGQIDNNGFTVPFSKVPKNHTKLQDSETSKNVQVKSNLIKDDRTVFLSNLSYDVSEEQLQELFSKVGEILEIRLVKDFKGRSKGYGYAEFLSPEMALFALEQDRIPINGRPVFVSKCEDKKSEATIKKEFKYSTGLEQRKLFVRGLPFKLNEEQVSELFKPYGQLKKVRLVTYRNGHSKGIAYVEYESEIDATNAVIKMDNSEVETHIISVAISNPPERKERNYNNDQVTKLQSLGGGDRNSGGREHAKTKLSFLPRALKKSNAMPIEIDNLIDSKFAEEGNEKIVTKPLNNSDFRSLLLK